MSFYDRIRHPRAPEAATAASIDWDPASLQEHKYCLLVTYRRNGEPVPTPVWFGVADARLFFLTTAESPKVKRLRRDPRVRVAPCSVRGRPLGPPMEGRARVVESGDERERAEREIAAHYGLGRALYEAFSDEREKGVYVEVSAAA